MGLDGDLDITTAEVRQAAALAYQLPPDSRVKAAMEPASAHGTEVLLLREIEHNQRLWHWANTKQAKHQETAPERLTLPGEDEAYERAAEEADEKALAAARKLGIEL